MNIFIMGAPGSGKGTFSTKIKEEFNLNHISTGDMNWVYKQKHILKKVY